MKMKRNLHNGRIRLLPKPAIACTYNKLHTFTNLRVYSLGKFYEK
jgi:hypothetical protein